jgi:rRNA-processing protein FCF1
VKVDEGNDHDKDIIEILRNKKCFLITNDYHLIQGVDWASLTDMLWEFY